VIVSLRAGLASGEPCAIGTIEGPIIVDNGPARLLDEDCA
jgi:hypothetical protein